MSGRTVNPATGKPAAAERGERLPALAHEGRNALQRIQVCLEMLAIEVQDRPAALDLVQRIQLAQDDLAEVFRAAFDGSRAAAEDSPSCR